VRELLARALVATGLAFTLLRMEVDGARGAASLARLDAGANA
jgi:hypothetical protein